MRWSPSTAAITAVAWTWPHLVNATRLWIWDDYTYHMIYPALWLRDHAIAAPLPSSFCATGRDSIDDRIQ